MIAMIDEYRYELLKVSGFAQDTVENYGSTGMSVVNFHKFSNYSQYFSD